MTDACEAYTYVGAGGGQYVGCSKSGCTRIDRPVPCSDALGALKVVEYLRTDCPIVDRVRVTPLVRCTDLPCDTNGAVYRVPMLYGDAFSTREVSACSRCGVVDPARLEA